MRSIEIAEGTVGYLMEKARQLRKVNRGQGKEFEARAEAIQDIISMLKKEPRMVIFGVPKNLQFTLLECADHLSAGDIVKISFNGEGTFFCVEKLFPSRGGSGCVSDKLIKKMVSSWCDSKDIRSESDDDPGFSTKEAQFKHYEEVLNFMICSLVCDDAKAFCHALPNPQIVLNAEEAAKV